MAQTNDRKRPGNVRFHFDVEPLPEHMPPEDNASCWGEPEDAAYAARIRRAMENGDPWAWFTARATLSIEGIPFIGTVYVGGYALYDGKADFMRCHGEDLKAEAFEDLKRQLTVAITTDRMASRLLKVLPDALPASMEA